MRGPRIYNSLSPEEQRARLKRKQKQKIREVHRVRINRIIAVFAIIVVILGIQIAIMLAKTKRIDGQVQAAKQSLTKVNRQRKDLAAKKADLKDPDYVAKLIREKFYYSKPNEKVFNLPRKNNSDQ
ncbi:septum formation initiator family protein [Lactobacillus sp. ESL0791]|uniref:FtsB family cell division protein n=1 Tax=Lactobacillus sp. ESL0791 TaxID=2983234 RepID=UPI0023F673AD|nr:septum formation initiator family protein [Lactobacillus sp. ESL0791]MDF7639478.1 septum formation initiator family protein [Lactobacillus sp. ESL0791]